MITIAKIQIRSTNKKHLWKIGNKTLFEICIDNLLKTELIDNIFMWVDDIDTLKDLVKKAGYLDSIHFIKRPRSMIHYGNSITTISDWHNNFTQEIINHLGDKINDIAIVFHININFALISSYTYQVLYNKLMEDDKANSIFPITQIKPHLFTINPQTNYLFPIWQMSGLDRQLYPPLYRRLGSSIEHVKREKIANNERILWHQVPLAESIDIETETDLEMAKYFISKKNEQY